MRRLPPVRGAMLSGYPINDARRIGDSALAIWFLAAAVWLACIGIAWLADQKRGL